jgi:urease accessory protein
MSGAVQSCSAAVGSWERLRGQPSWQAQLQLGFASRAGKTYLARRLHSGPLLVQRPFYPEGSPCHTYIVHPPGGVVGGDELRLDVDAAPGSHVLLTTPAAAKFYRSDGRTARQMQTLRAEGAAIEWLPQESIFYPAARVRSTTRIELATRSRFIGWEMACLGLPARDEPFDAGELRLHLELCVDGAPLLIDRLRLSGAESALGASWGLAGHIALGTLLAYPAERTALEAVRDIQVERVELAATLVDKVLVVRCLAQQAESIRRAFIQAWQRLRPQLLDRAAVLPRIWAT